MKNIKHIYLILSILISTISVGQTSILETPIKLETKKYSIFNLLSIISNKTKLSFSYDANIINGDSIIRISQGNTNTKKILEKICKTTHYELSNNIVIINKNKTSLKRTKRNTKKNIKTIKGNIINSKGKAIPHATITIKSKNIGTISNTQGNFTLKIKKENLNDTISINHIGYKPYKKAIKDISNNHLNITLNSKTFSMQEIIVWSGDPELLVEEAYKHGEKNYYKKPFHINAFYREIITTKKQVKTISEGIINVYRKTRRNYSKNQVKVLKSRKFYNYTNSDSIALKLQAGLGSIFNLDVAHQWINFYNSNSSELYKYSFSELTTLNNENVAVIKFSPKNKYSNTTLFKGLLYIGIDSKALLACKFKLTNKSINKIGKTFIFKKNRRIKAKLLSVSYFVLYSQYSNKYFLNHIFGELNFSVRHKGSILSKKFKIRYELAVTKIDTTSTKPFKREERTNKHRIFIEQIPNNPNSFWDNYNYIKPNNSIYKELTKLGVQVVL